MSGLYVCRITRTVVEKACQQRADHGSRKDNFVLTESNIGSDIEILDVASGSAPDDLPRLRSLAGSQLDQGRKGL